MQDWVPSTFVTNSITGRPVSATENSITVQLGDEDIAFVLGKQGVTKNKLAQVSGARLEIDERTDTMTITGPPENRRRAQEYIDMVLVRFFWFSVCTGPCARACARVATSRARTHTRARMLRYRLKQNNAR